jgi:hypothetical protein
MMSLADEVMKQWQSGRLAQEGFDYDSEKNTFHVNVSDTYPITNIKYHNIGNAGNLSN